MIVKKRKKKKERKTPIEDSFDREEDNSCCREKFENARSIEITLFFFFYVDSEFVTCHRLKVYTYKWPRINDIDQIAENHYCQSFEW